MLQRRLSGCSGVQKTGLEIWFWLEMKHRKAVARRKAHVDSDTFAQLNIYELPPSLLPGFWFSWKLYLLWRTVAVKREHMPCIFSRLWDQTLSPLSHMTDYTCKGENILKLDLSREHSLCSVCRYLVCKQMFCVGFFTSILPTFHFRLQLYHCVLNWICFSFSWTGEDGWVIDGALACLSQRKYFVEKIDSSLKRVMKACVKLRLWQNAAVCFNSLASSVLMEHLSQIPPWLNAGEGAGPCRCKIPFISRLDILTELKKILWFSYLVAALFQLTLPQCP